MRIGQQVSSFTWPGAPASIGPTLGNIARWSEYAGATSFWVMDHFWQIPAIGPSEQEMLEAYTTLGYVAGQTSRIELGAMVTGAHVRNPALLLKTVTTLDVLSGGRAWLGIGAGWYEDEAVGYGIDFPSTRDRFVRLEDTLRLALQMWDADDAPFRGIGYRAPRPLNSPRPLRRPPILVGGVGEQKTLRMVAQYADGTNLFDAGPEYVAGKLAVLREHCENLGRDFGAIRKTVLTRVSLSQQGGGRAPSGEQTMSVAQAVDKFGALAMVGIDTAVVGMGNDVEESAYALLAEVVKQVSEL